MRKNRGSRWDWLVPGEDDQTARRRRATSAALCKTCPLTARTACKTRHAGLAAEAAPYTVPGVWGGTIYRDKQPATTDIVQMLFGLDAA
ncbi:hypothetical protein ACFO5K_04355 [Nocardia halotolerans]|uniref:4Fe-4S Wbl-type domain-containing protein n=1 Tax=Nocardia halotolerans TaxID=1755878 RepID=A0ABV8VBL6_9NOCA